MNGNSFLKILGLGYLDLKDVVPYFMVPNEDCKYYYKGRLNDFEREILKAETLLFDRTRDLALELEAKMKREDEQEGELVVDYDEHEAVAYMISRATASYIPLMEESEATESDRSLCASFLEKKIRERFNIPWVHGYIVTERYAVYWYYLEYAEEDSEEDY